ncbi:MAG: hypothetical protein M3680_00390 [Myxococcota bacterium]|nr:hypothetical protein [Myxococcota bacterium]
MTTESAELQTQVRTDVRHVLHLQEMARKSKDIIKLSCVNDAYIAMKAEANMFDESRLQLEVTLASARDERFTVFTQVSTRANNVRVLREIADRCVGETDLAESANDYTSPEFPDDPTKGDAFDPPIEPPGYASPYN